jgi:hypothetical protein
MPQIGLEPMIPVFDRAKTVHAWDRAATVIGAGSVTRNNTTTTDNTHLSTQELHYSSFDNTMFRSTSEWFIRDFICGSCSPWAASGTLWNDTAQAQIRQLSYIQHNCTWAYLSTVSKYKSSNGNEKKNHQLWGPNANSLVSSNSATYWPSHEQNDM